MSEHLPECYLSGSPSMCPMCDALRACEQRVFQEQIEGRQHDMVMAYLRALDAAREAVAGQCGHTKSVSSIYQCDHDRAVAAIDGLRANNP